MKILSFGEILWDVYPDEKYLGGASLNFAAHLAKNGEEAYMLSALGQDDLGADAKKMVEKWNVSTQFVAELSQNETGKCLVTLDKNRIPSYNLLDHVAYDYIPTDAVEGDFDVLYFGTLALRGEYNRASLERLLARKQFREVFVDVNIRPPFYSKESVRFAFSKASIVKVSDEELPVVQGLLGMEKSDDYKAFAAALAKTYQNLNCVIITRGGEGAYALNCKAGSDAACPSEKVKVVSTVGAGDSFSAGFLHKYLAGAPLADCLAYATKIAGFVVSQYDAVPEYPAEGF